MKAIRISKVRAYLEDGTSWPRYAGERVEELSWRLHHGQPSRSDHLLAASILEAYAYLIRLPQRRRAQVISALRHAETLEES